VDTVLFEGPLDRGSLDQVSEIGRSPEAGSPRLVDCLSRQEIVRLERVVCGPRGPVARLLGLQYPNPPDVGYLLSETRPWMAFFSLWTGFLARQGWTQSVDLEAWHLALDMGKAVRAMETIPEQIRTLENIPVERIVSYLRQCRRWKGYLQRNMRAYLRGDLEGMMGTSTEFPSRTELVIQRRDRTFLERMRPFLEEGRCAVFVGSAHMLHLRHMLVQAGYTVRKVSMIVPGLLSRVTAEAVTPEQVLPFACTVSDSRARMIGNCVGLESEGDLVLVGYPLHDPLDMKALNEAVDQALRIPNLERLTVIGPARPSAAPEKSVVEEDCYYALPLPPPPPGQKLRNLLRRAARELKLERNSPWGEHHAALVRGYLDGRHLGTGTRWIFRRLPRYLDTSPGSLLLSRASRWVPGRFRCRGIFLFAHGLFHVFLSGPSPCPTGHG